MKVIAFRVKPDSDLYRDWFAARQEKERFQNLAREFMERHFGGPKNYVITGKLTVELTEEDRERYAGQLIKGTETYDGRTFSKFRSASELQRLWKQEVCDKASLQTIYGTAIWNWDFIKGGGKVTREMWVDSDGSLYGLVDGEEYGTELVVPDYVEPMNRSEYYALVEKEFGEDRG